MSACTRYPDDEQVVRYVRGNLDEPDLSAFEDHLFGCDLCLDRVERYQAAREILAGRDLAIPTAVPSVGGPPPGAGRAGWWRLGALAATLVIVAGGAWSWQRRSVEPDTSGTQQAAAVADGRSAQAPSKVRNEADLQLAVLAMVTPPPYLAITTRDEGAPPGLFAAGMRAYTEGNWTLAARSLATVGTAEARFYQGIADLMRGDPTAAVAALEAARASGVQPYARESAFYLGKAALQRGEIGRAREAFAAATADRASTADEAARLLEALADVTQPDRGGR